MLKIFPAYDENKYYNNHTEKKFIDEHIFALLYRKKIILNWNKMKEKIAYG